MVTWFDVIFNTIIVAIIVFVVIIGYRIIMFLVRRGAKKQNIPLEATNGIKIIVRLITLLLIIVAILTFIPGFTSYLLTISSITGIIVGFASTQIVSQFIAGIYLLTSRPFKVNDLVKINGIDGLITEIGLNFTTLQKFNGTVVKIPNKTILDAEILKYTIKITPDIISNIINPNNSTYIVSQEKKLEKVHIKSKKVELKKLKLSNIKDMIIDSDIIRYTFEIAVDLDQVPEKVVSAINNVCEIHKKIYRYRPQFILNYIYWRAHFRFKIYCQNPYIVIRNHSYFVNDLMIAIYGGK